MFSLETANRVLAPAGQVIQNEARGGWSLHSCVVIPATVYRKKGFFEKLFGWIPIIGSIFRGNQPDEIHPQYYSLIFVKEV